MDLDRQALRWFVEVADQLHFTRAAAALGISRSRLTGAVLALEEAVGQPLFVRPSERTELTPAGTDLRARAEELLATPEATGTPPAATFRVAIVPGVTVSKWTRVWAERRPHLPLEVVRADEVDPVAVLHEGRADVAFVRLPVDRTGLNVIPLYEEVMVVVLDVEHVLTLLDEVSVLDLVEEHLLQDPDTVPGWRDAAAGLRTAPLRPLPEMRDVADAIALVAAGVGVVVVPQSIARLHHRKDVTYRPVADLDRTEVGLAWVADATTPEIEEWVGVVRGRSARSSRSAGPSPDQVQDVDPARAPSPRRAGGRPSSPGGRGGARGGPPAPRGRRRGSR